MKLLCLIFSIIFLFCGCANKQVAIPEAPADISAEEVIEGETYEHAFYFPFVEHYNSIAIIANLGNSQTDAKDAFPLMVDRYYPPSIKADQMLRYLEELEEAVIENGTYYLFLPRFTGTTFTVKKGAGNEALFCFDHAFILVADKNDPSVCVDIQYNEISDQVYPGAFSDGNKIYGVTNHVYDITEAYQSDDVSVMDRDFSEQLVHIASGKIGYDVENKGVEAPEKLWNAILCAASENVASGYIDEDGNVVLYDDELEIYANVLYGLSIQELPPMPESISCYFDAENRVYIFKPIPTPYPLSFSEQMVSDNGCVLFIAQFKNNEQIKRYRTDWEYADNDLGMQMTSLTEE